MNYGRSSCHKIWKLSNTSIHNDIHTGMSTVSFSSRIFCFALRECVSWVHCQLNRKSCQQRTGPFITLDQTWLLVWESFLSCVSVIYVWHFCQCITRWGPPRGKLSFVLFPILVSFSKISKPALGSVQYYLRIANGQFSTASFPDSSF